MAYGIEIFNSAGVMTLSSEGRILRYHSTVTYGQILDVGTVFIPDAGMTLDGTWVASGMSRIYDSTFDTPTNVVVAEGGLEIRTLGWNIVSNDGTFNLPVIQVKTSWSTIIVARC